MLPLIATEAQAAALGFDHLTETDLRRASGRIRSYTKQTVTQKDHEHIESNDWALLGQFPVVSIIGVYQMDGTTTVPWRRTSATTLDIPARRPVIVRYRAGYASEEMPEDILEITCLIANRIQNEDDDPAGATTQSERVGEVTRVFGFDSFKGASGSLLTGEKEVLRGIFPGMSIQSYGRVQ